MLSQDSEDEMWSRFMFELLIWLQEVTLKRWTQPSGPLCLWQCFLSLSGDLGIGLVWDNHLIPYNISVWILKSCSNYLWWVVLSCSHNDVRCFQLFHRCFQMFLDVFGVLRMLSRCVQMVTNLGCWISSRSSLGVLLMFSGFFQDFLRMFWRVLCAPHSGSRGFSP